MHYHDNSPEAHPLSLHSYSADKQGSLSGQGENKGIRVVWEELARILWQPLGDAHSPPSFTGLSSCVSSHMPRQWVQICLVTWSILYCPISNRHRISCQDQLIRGWSVRLDLQSGNAKPIRCRLNKLWTQNPLPASRTQGARINTHMMPTHRPFSFWGAPRIVLDWTHAVNRCFTKPCVLELLKAWPRSGFFCLLNKSNEAKGVETITFWCPLACPPPLSPLKE